MSWRYPDYYKCADGTMYMVQSELVRGEGRFYWAEVRTPERREWRMTDAFDGSTDKRTVMRRIEKQARDCHGGPCSDT